jgi:hypothetical protein
MVVVPDDAPEGKRRSRLAYTALRCTGVAADIIVWPRSRFNERAHLASSLPGIIMQEGKLLYAA